LVFAIRINPQSVPAALNRRQEIHHWRELAVRNIPPAFALDIRQSEDQ
jgi:hypothetical protein